MQKSSTAKHIYTTFLSEASMVITATVLFGIKLKPKIVTLSSLQKYFDH